MCLTDDWGDVLLELTEETKPVSDKDCGLPYDIAEYFPDFYKVNEERLCYIYLIEYLK